MDDQQRHRQQLILAYLGACVRGEPTYRYYKRLLAQGMDPDKVCDLSIRIIQLTDGSPTFHCVCTRERPPIDFRKRVAS